MVREASSLDKWRFEGGKLGIKGLEIKGLEIKGWRSRGYPIFEVSSQRLDAPQALTQSQEGLVIPGVR